MTTLETRRVVFAVLAELPTGLIEEYVRHLHRDKGEPTDAEAGVDFDRWMRLVNLLQQVELFEGNVRIAFLLLIDLLQPPSVREARAKQ